ncbi:MAG TPA: L,D-transpeptidase [Solirubrobacteraceae bacterium]|nr:L,D-transpeptidase [Solirubrobacteraceae bacterium]
MLVAVAAVVVAGVTLTSAKASLSADSVALAKIGMPLGGGSIESISVVTGPHSQAVPVKITNGKIYPTKLIPANEQLQIQVTVKRPGWISWLAGSKQKLQLTLTTPAASLRSHYITVRNGSQLKAHFRGPVSAYTFGTSPKHMTRTVLPRPSDTITLPHAGVAGTEYLSASPRTWESAKTATINYFPAGKSATVVASPTPGATIKPSTPIQLTFSKPVGKAIGSHMPVISPSTPGSWHQINSHTIRFEPTGYGYGLDAKVQLALPSGVRLLGGQSTSTSSTGTWTVPGGSVVRLQQLLAIAGYLPLTFHYAGGKGPGLTPAAQENAAVDPPKGTFSWRYPDTPQRLKDMWSVGSLGTMMEGAIMAFENDNDIYSLPYDGPTSTIWKTLISDVVAGKGNSFGYTFVDVSVSSQSLVLWHSGKTVIGGTPVNTGIPSAPTSTGTYPVYEHLTSTTMSGTNPDGSHYNDPNIPWVSYFNGGDALHGFNRASYGSPQSLGCVEMPFSVAGQVWPYTPIGTLVDVHD